MSGPSIFVLELAISGINMINIHIILYSVEVTQMYIFDSDLNVMPWRGWYRNSEFFLPIKGSFVAAQILSKFTVRIFRRGTKY